MVTDELSPAQQRTMNARRAFQSQFKTPEEKSEHYRGMAEKANAGRVVLRAEDAAAVRQAYELLGRIAERLPDSVEAAA